MKKGSIFLTIGLLLIAAALFLTGYNLWDSHRAGLAADAALEQLAERINSDPIPEKGRPVPGSQKANGGTAEALTDEIEYPDYILNPNMEMPTEKIDGRDYIGVLTIPAIDLELPVCSEWSTYNLSYSPCRYVGSAYLDNMIICAHNFDTFFRNLKNLSYGDTVEFTDIDGNVFTYQVIEMINILPTAPEELTAGEWDLTLFTCTPGAAYRVTVRLDRRE